MMPNFEIKKCCDETRKKWRRIRHLGYYNEMGRILYDSRRDGLVPLEGEEEKHILNATVASTLSLWRRSDRILGPTEAIIMMRGRITALMIPISPRSGNYLLSVFDKDTPISYIEKVRSQIARHLRPN